MAAPERKPKKVLTPSELAEQFRELQRLREKVRALEQSPSGQTAFGRPDGPYKVMRRNHKNIEYTGLTGAKPAWAEVWHLWKIIIPRRTITGRLVCGTVWRRHDGRHWIYKKFIEYAQDRAE